MTEKLCVIGDSITGGVVYRDDAGRYVKCRESFVNLLGSELGLDVHNHSRFGCTSTAALERLGRYERDIAECDYTLVMLGGNDCDFNWSEVARAPESVHHPHTPIGQFLDAVSQMAKSLKDAGVKPVLMSLPPLDAQRYLNFIGRLGNNTTNILHWLGDVNRIYRYQEMYSNQISRLAAKLNLPLIDVRSRFLDRRDCGQLIARDGIHLTEAGYRLLLDEARLTLAGMSAY